MSILIRDAKMPDECWECKLNSNLSCAVNGEVIALKGRRNNCPLIELPENHDRLIEEETVCREFMEAILDEFQKTQCIRATSNEIWDVLKKVPTIIEAEGET